MARQRSLFVTVNKILDLMNLSNGYSHTEPRYGFKKAPTWLPHNASQMDNMYGALNKALKHLTSPEFIEEWCNIGCEMPLDKETFNLILSRIPKLEGNDGSFNVKYLRN